MRRRQRRMKANPLGYEGLALQGASAALRGLGVESTTPGAARLASAPLQSQRGSRGILRQAPKPNAAFLPGYTVRRTGGIARPRGVLRRQRNRTHEFEPLSPQASRQGRKSRRAAGGEAARSS